MNGEELIADLARDALTLNDMQRMCEHVHAHGERKGKEGKGREGEGEAKTLPPRDASEIERAEFVATIKTDYPPPQGRVDWITAEKAACQAVLNQGATWQQLIDGVRRYRAYIAATGSYVMNPAKFFAAVDRPWFQPWTIPPPRAAGGAPYRRAKTPDELEAEEAARNAQ